MSKILGLISLVLLSTGCTRMGTGAVYGGASADDEFQLQATSPSSVVLTPASGGSITDSKGNVWAFLSGTLTAGDNCDIRYGKNGIMPYGGAAATHLVIYKGVLHQLSCVYGWYRDTGTGFAPDSAADAAALDKLIAASVVVVVTADITIKPGAGSFVDSKGATWKLDANYFIARNNSGVAGVPYPNNAWQSNMLVFRQADKRVYAFASDSQWYYYDDALGLLVLSSLSPVASNPSAFVPPGGTAPSLPSSPSPAPGPAPAPVPVPSPSPSPSGFNPPGRVVMVSSCSGNAANDTAAVTNAANSAGAGNTVQFANGQRCVLNTINLTAGVYYYVPNGQTATLVAASGATIFFKNNVTFNGISMCGFDLDLVSTSSVTIGNSNLGLPTCDIGHMVINGSSGLQLINNNISNTRGEFMTGYLPTGFNFDGNIFDHCKGDCIAMPYGAGTNSIIQRNVFQNSHLAVMEIGFAATNQPTINFRLVNNYAHKSLTPAAFKNGFGYQLAYSIPLNGVGSRDNLIANNYADGMTPEGKGDICIEISGAATVRDNQCSNFEFGALAYHSAGACSVVESFINNNFSGTIYGTVVSYLGCSGASLPVSGTTTNVLAAPPMPTRIAWGGR